MTQSPARSIRRLTSKKLASLALAALFLAPEAALTQETVAQIDASRVSCRDLQRIVKQEGVVIVHSETSVAEFNLGYYLFGGADRETGGRFRGRFVANRRFCQFNERLISREVSARDTDVCYLKMCADRTVHGNSR